MKYVLNAKFSYDSDNDVLSVINTPETEVTLTITASKIFHVLLENHGHDMSREALMDALWEKYKIHPSGNSLNQYISILRKTLVDIGCDANIIITIPKVGFCIPSNMVSLPPSDNNGVTVFGRISKSRNIVLATLAIIFLGLFLSLWINFNEEKISNMHVLTELNGCSVYTLGNGLESGKEIIINEIKGLQRNGMLPTTCEPGFFYLTSVENVFSKSKGGRFFVAQCSRENSNLTNCISVYENKN